MAIILFKLVNDLNQNSKSKKYFNDGLFSIVYLE